ncbi:DUF2059 domain-containing protein [Phenylobacterium sp. SCN 70-31]|uniref:DUF2059 domain-containing protein n=1 Tax=Phenylobacterium sp. SCN 70-31 TaxID=1660129 RepID=UPI00086934B8|nr:DUF2059 domain-containing protein [Phenylobacterium sp. SCN 70-31]ODT87572.1 MAG: hypothetical protein ABS78_11945 [Phenylobacterium sp. SCN 70-31]
MRKWVLVGFVAGLAFGTPAWAEPSDDARDLARRYMAALRMESQVSAMMNNLMPAMIERAAKAQGQRPNAELTEAVTHAAAESMRAMTPMLMEAMIPATVETFSREELQAAVDYYESPLGQSLVAKTPAFMARSVPALNALMPRMERDMQERICKEIGCETR